MSKDKSAAGLLNDYLVSATWREPQSVTVVRPHRPKAEMIGSALARYLIGPLLFSWIIMLLLPHTMLDADPGFWAVFATFWVARLLFGDKDESAVWTTSKREILGRARRAVKR